MAEDPDLMNENEDDPDMYYIAQGEGHIDVANWIYEFINLSIPMQKACAYDKMDGPHCNASASDVLKNMESKITGRTIQTEDDKKTKNPIWKGLENFKDLN